MKKEILILLEFFVLFFIWRVLVFASGIVLNFFHWNDIFDPFWLMIIFALLWLVVVVIISRLIHKYYNF